MNLGAILASPHEFEHNGKSYQVSLITQDVKAAYEKKLFQKAKTTIANEMKPFLSPDEYLGLLKATADSYSRGDYRLDEGSIGKAGVCSAEGLILLTSLLFKHDGKAVSEEEMRGIIEDKPTEVVQLVTLVFQESFNHAK